MKARYVILVGLATLCAGFALGEIRAKYVLKPYLKMAQTAFGAALADYSDVQHHVGSPQEYEASLQDLLRGLDDSEHWPMDPWPRRYLAFERLLANTRVAKSQAARGATEESRRSMQAAIAACKDGAWPNCAEDHLQAVVKWLEERNEKRAQAK